MSKQVLLVDDDREVREALGQTLELADLSPVLAGSFIAAKDHITADFDGVIVTDIRMPGRDGFHLLTHTRSVDPDLPVILLTGEADVPMAVRAMSEGAFGFLEKPCGPQDLLGLVGKALHGRGLVLENRRLKLQVAQGDAAARMLRGTSAQSQQLRERVRAAARAAAEVVVTGEPGSGIAKVAEVIHLLSSAGNRPFVKCAAASLTTQTLGAAFQDAASGTLYLDEITGLAPAVQFALMDTLENGASARVISGTTQDIAASVDAGHLNGDLFYRLDLMRVHITPLRDRSEDIPVLFRHYVSVACEQANLPEPDITPDVLGGLMAQDWPGNARSLMNAAMRFAMGISDMPRADADDILGLAEQMAQVERSLIIAALRRNDGQVTQTAQTLRLPRKTFYDKLARHGLRAESFRKRGDAS
ncbi:sigma-54-dependent transcriptional regulator [Octadecabacter sp. R77987]|uniref:sigma-54-dependent transcriptional regulator n=1 Tax=Octadecabacter sp. R77987 TaxID=3093874 RepID=UPI00366F4A4A